MKMFKLARNDHKKISELTHELAEIKKNLSEYSKCFEGVIIKMQVKMQEQNKRIDAVEKIIEIVVKPNLPKTLKNLRTKKQITKKRKIL